MSDKPHLGREHGQHLYRQMLRIRRFEAKCAELYQAQKIRGFLHLYDGEEAVAVGIMEVLEDRDAVVDCASVGVAKRPQRRATGSRQIPQDLTSDVRDERT